MKQVNTEEIIAQSLIKIVCDFTAKYSGILIQMAVANERKEIINKMHPDNFASQIDVELHNEYLVKLSEVLPSFILVSEEGDPQIYPVHSTNFPEFLVIIDPLDTGDLAVRGLYGYTQALVYSLKEQIPIAAVVGDMFHTIQVYYAFRDPQGNDHAFLMTRGSVVEVPIRSSQETSLHKALVTGYSMRPLERFKKIAEQEPLLTALAKPDETGQRRGRIGLDFGSVGLCHVAAGFTDAMIEIAKGFYIWDLFPGQYILHAAGGNTVSLDGSVLPLNLNIHCLDDAGKLIGKRQKFVAAGNSTLLESILKALK